MEFVSQHATVVAADLIPIGTILAMFACMMPGPNDRASVTRDPPRYDPANESRYSFRQYSRDVMLWSVYNYNLNPAQKVVVCILQLRGSARTLADTIPPDALINGVVLIGSRPGHLLPLLSLDSHCGDAWIDIHLLSR